MGNITNADLRCSRCGRRHPGSVPNACATYGGTPSPTPLPHDTLLRAAFLRGVRAGLERAAYKAEGFEAKYMSGVCAMLADSIRAIDPQSVEDK